MSTVKLKAIITHISNAAAVPERKFTDEKVKKIIVPFSATYPETEVQGC